MDPLRPQMGFNDKSWGKVRRGSESENFLNLINMGNG